MEIFEGENMGEAGTNTYNCCYSCPRCQRPLDLVGQSYWTTAGVALVG